jgi:hypothetical protein
MTKEQEEKARSIVSAGQWSVSWAIVAALLVTVARVPTWDWMGWVIGWYIAGAGPIWLIAGMYLCWRLPDARRFLVIPLEIIILLCGVAMIEWQLERGKDVEANGARQAFLDSPSYKTALDAYNIAKADWEGTATRTGAIPGDFTTGARENKAAGDEKKAAFEKAKRDLLALEPQIPKGAENKSVDNLFSFAGPDWAPWIKGIVLLLLAAGDQAVAMANTWRRSEKPGPVQRRAVPSVPAPKPVERPQAPRPALAPIRFEPIKTARDYMAAATEGRNDGKAWGRETVAKKLGISERQVRKLYDECVAQGLIRPGTAPKLAAMSSAQN